MGFGRSLMDNTRSSSSSSSDDDDESSVALLAAGMLIAGSLLYPLGRLLQSWHSRRREFVADEAAVALTGTGVLADALAKIEQTSWEPQSGNALAAQNPQFSHLYISSHSDRESGFFGFISSLLRSHPQTHERKQAIGQTLRKVALSFDKSPEPRSTM